jgi:hypothetical protein
MLSEHAALTVFDVPLAPLVGGYRRFWLPPPVAKGRSARWVYVPPRVARDLAAYSECDRAESVAQAQSVGRYRRWRRPWVVEDPGRAEAHRVGDGARVKVAHLDSAERRNLLVDGPDGLAPAWFWLGKTGAPLSTSAWKAMFGDGNRRCAAAGPDLQCHAHLLRHTFAVVTLEQMQRGHVAALAEMVPQQREHDTRIFSDPPRLASQTARARLGAHHPRNAANGCATAARSSTRGRARSGASTTTPRSYDTACPITRTRSAS